MSEKQDKRYIGKLPLICAMVALLVLVTGCWSAREIEELGIAIGTAVDFAGETKLQQELEEAGGDYPKKNVLTMTYQVVDSGYKISTGKGGSGNKENYRNLSVTGDSIYEMTREISLKWARPIFGQHHKVIVLSDKLVRTYGLRQLLDFFVREQEFRPSCPVLISKGEARKTLELADKSEFPAMKLIGIIDNQYRSSRLLPKMSLTKALSAIYASSSFLLQNVITTEGQVKLAGAAVIYGKTGKLIGFLDEEDLEAVTWLTAKAIGGIVKSYDERTGNVIAYEITSVKNNIRSRLNRGKFSFDIQIVSDGRLGEQWTTEGNDFDPRFIREVEAAAAKQVEARISGMLQKVQKEYRADVLGLGDHVRIHYPRQWARIKKNWDDIFADATIRYSVKLNVKEFGTTSAQTR
ncbi:Ger(x)C family spore germination protein [Paenibacillus melissococcoides]|uniref:Ger(X)C family spore germination protein n=1 Tax=Paenibacillus melissococcoides TaxID=2912268 RepID=A0ABM9G077_9BACL|nr:MULTISPECIES: Ger(x)C family spore germination protein [Paenibacillus]MEB9895302.1 Ger(x)C family spore germination protein [Bacillus cereus]CAH8244984.1 Ger(x)C family spore germination protein [Paenibacillus melissococcoides]CAH8709561.1 Ger(x)C family spore germination protein [Paenibacillus melissococcoides]CAH8710288.1 Ger(x)C family spore germination protein [Paenibacillus melissococcoides]GIO78332.1 germination protein BC [Paenibacillus dendritiformis]